MNCFTTKVFVTFLITSTIYHEFAVAIFRKHHLLKALVGAGFVLQKLHPKKGVLPIPLPMPLPIPIEWEQPPIVISPKHNHVPVPHPVPMPIHMPVNVPVYQHSSKNVMKNYGNQADYGSYASESQDNWQDDAGYEDTEYDDGYRA